MGYYKTFMAGCAALALAGCKTDISEITDDQLLSLLGNGSSPAQITEGTRECVEVLGGVNEAVGARLRSIVQRIGETQDVQEAMALNSYARAEVARLVANLTRLRAARNRTASAHTVALAAERQREQQYMNFDMEDLD